MNLTKSSPQKSKNVVSEQSGLLLAIIGPTCSGKTQSAIDTARQTGAEIICADSRTIYRGMNIGTAKPTSEETALIPHYGLDLIDPDEQFSASDFQTYAYQKMDEIWSRGNPVILVGGSGMYLDAVLYGYNFRTEKMRAEIERMDNDQLVDLIEKEYPDTLKADDVNNTRRLRQILTRGPSSKSDREHLKYNVKIIGISPEKSILQKRIRIRAKDMLNNGLVQEYKMITKTWGSDCVALSTIGYASVGRYLKDKLHMEELEDDIVRSSMRLVKKQMTWFKRNQHIEWMKSPKEAADKAIFYLNG
jgi:tRNA dimethylallyltransferase